MEKNQSQLQENFLRLGKKSMFYLVFFCILFIVFVRFLEKKSMFYPIREVQMTPKDLGLQYIDIYFPTEDGVELNAWLIKNPEAKGTVLFFHGNAGNIGGRVEKIKILHDMGLNVFILDYRGYGRSGGKPSEEGLNKDVQAAYDYLDRREDIDIEKTAIYGVSLGGIFAIDLAMNRSVKCLIVDSSISSAKDMAKLIYPIIPTFLIKAKLDSVGKVSQLKMPKLFLHSRDDEIIPFKIGQKLYDAAKSPKKFIAVNGGHNDWYILYQDRFIQSISLFLKEQGIIEG